MPELNFVFNVVHDVFILKGTDSRDTIIYGVFTSQWSVRSNKTIDRRALILPSLPHEYPRLAGATWDCRPCVPTT